jgi:hypothetical protein
MQFGTHGSPPCDVFLHDSGWYTDDLDVVRNIFDHHRTRTYNRMRSDSDVVDHNRAYADIRSFTDVASPGDVSARLNGDTVADFSVVSD